MIVLLNGALGVGKTETSDQLTQLFERAVMLDGDYLGAVHPFEIYDEARVTYLYETIYHIVKFHHDQGGYHHFVVNYVFETPEALTQLRTRLCEIEEETHAFRLVCADEEMAKRIQTRNPDLERLAWELSRAKELAAIQETAADLGDLGFVIDTTRLTARQAAQKIWDNIHEAVEVVPYDPRWPELFAAERTQILQAVGEWILAVEHIGSTAIDGLPAKPVIDIAVMVNQLADAFKCLKGLRRLGYSFINYPQNTDRLFLRKGEPRTHHIHLEAQGSESLRQHLRFRDTLRIRTDLRAEYAALKFELMHQFKHRRITYSERKTEFVQRVLRSTSDSS